LTDKLSFLIHGREFLSRKVYWLINKVSRVLKKGIKEGHVELQSVGRKCPSHDMPDMAHEKNEWHQFANYGQAA
jgi:hypothetical protein